MDLERKKYIREQVEIDYVLKSRNSALGFLVVAILFLFLHAHHHVYWTYITVLTLVASLLAITRYNNAKNYQANKKPLAKAARFINKAAILNGILWCTIGILSVLSYDKITIHILITFIILITFSATSVVTLSHKRFVFFAVNILVHIPQIFYSFYEFNNASASLWLLAYTAISMIYAAKQASVVQRELQKNFMNEFDLKKSLAKVAQSKKELEEESAKTFHASRLSSLGEMAGGVAHEINNPLTIIQGMAKSMLVHDELMMDEHTKDKLRKINQASDRIAKIVKGMKIISSKNDQIEHEIVKISKIIDISMGLFEEKIKNEAIVFSLENVTDPFVKCNPLQISQIIINLISNAIDALLKDNKEKILIIRVTEDFLNHAVDIRVMNSGELIPHETAIKIFEPFFSTKSLGQGTGLGLSISQTLAHSNEGFLSYEVYEGKVCFNLHLLTYDEV